MTKRLKILVSAYACEPGEGSEPGVGWNWVKQMARFHDVWAITRANNREPIEWALRKEPMPNVHWVYFDLPSWMRFWKKGQRGVHLYYYLWQMETYFVGKRLHKEVDFDLVHHVTFGASWALNFLAFSSIPCIWGPIVGAETAKTAFYHTFNWKSRAYELTHRLVNSFVYLNPVMKLAIRKTSVGIASTPKMLKLMSRLGCKKVYLRPSVGLPYKEIKALSSIQIREVPMLLCFLSIGRLVHWKGFHLALEAFAQYQNDFPDSEYWVIGDGPEKNRLLNLTHRLNINAKVIFWGWLERSELLEKLSECDILLHPCLHGAISMACIEAMAAARPVICLDLGGLALQVTDETGIRAPAITPEQVVNDLTEAMLQLARDAELRQRMGGAARRRVAEHFDWDKKGEWMDKIYRQILSS